MKVLARQRTSESEADGLFFQLFLLLLTMSILMQNRASFPDGMAVGVDDICSEILKAFPWGDVQHIMSAFKRRYWGFENVIVLIPKIVGIETLEGNTMRHLQSECAGQMVWWVPHHFAAY